MMAKLSFKVPPPPSLPCTLNKIWVCVWGGGENKNDSKLMLLLLGDKDRDSGNIGLGNKDMVLLVTLHF